MKDTIKSILTAISIAILIIVGSSEFDEPTSYSNETVVSEYIYSNYYVQGW